jgi:hypothetical protein
MAKKTLRKDRIIDTWLTIIDNGSGQQDQIYRRTEASLEEAKLPNVTWKRESVSSGMFGRSRVFLVVNHRTLKEYVMYLSARDYGQHLDCGWFLTVQPSFFQRTASEFANAQKNGGFGLDVFDQQDLSAWISVTHRAFMRSVKELMEELQLDITGMNTQSKGYLAVW